MKRFSSPLPFFCLLFSAACFLSSTLHAQMAQNVVRQKIAGLDVIAYPTGVQDVVTFRGSLPAGDTFAPPNNVAVPTLVGSMLDKGTTKNDKFAIAQKLESVGAKLAFSVDGMNVNFSGKCLRKDLPLVIELLAEQLRSPAFSEEELAKLKKQLVGNYTRALENTDFRAGQAFSEAVYPLGHPNYTPPIKDFLAAVETATVADLKKFHQEFYGPAQATLVVVGDFAPNELKTEVERAFAQWSGGQTRPQAPKAQATDASRDQVVFLADKTNISVIVGQGTGLKYSDPDALALRVGTAILGSGFTGRLMANVRDREGLTYGIGSYVAEDNFADGDWRITANFAPALLEQGMKSTNRELDQWYKDGVTAEELERTKADLVGSFKVGLATTDGLAGALLNAVHRGYDVSWLDEYPKRINALTLDQVNGAIKKHLKPEEMFIIKAGTVPGATATPAAK